MLFIIELLNKLPPKGYDVSHKIQVNESYRSKSLKVKIPLGTGKKKQSVQREKTQKVVAEVKFDEDELVTFF